MAQCNPSVCIRGRRLRVQDVVPGAEQETFTAGWKGGRRGCGVGGKQGRLKLEEARNAAQTLVQD